MNNDQNLTNNILKLNRKINNLENQLNQNVDINQSEDINQNLPNIEYTTQKYPNNNNLVAIQNINNTNNQNNQNNLNRIYFESAIDIIIAIYFIFLVVRFAGT